MSKGYRKASVQRLIAACRLLLSPDAPERDDPFGTDFTQDDAALAAMRGALDELDGQVPLAAASFAEAERIMTLLRAPKRIPSTEERALGLVAGSVSSPSVADSPTWQPIETAPKDGRPILVHDEGATMVSFWLEDEGMAGWWDNGLIEPPPQFWMPLPSAPSASAAEETDPTHD